MNCRKRAHKYGAVRTMIDGVTFASRKEAARYLELRLLERAGAITDLELQPKFALCVPKHGRTNVHVQVGTYRADFRYRDGPRGILVVEDVKSAGTKTTAYRLRKRMVEAQYGIEIKEV